MMEENLDSANVQLFYEKNGQSAGPFKLEEIPTTEIGRDTLVWMEGLDDWIPASDLPVLAAYFLKGENLSPDKEKLDESAESQHSNFSGRSLILTGVGLLSLLLTFNEGNLFIPYLGFFDEDGFVVIVLLRALVATILAVLANKKGRSRIGWFIFGLLIPTIALIVGGTLRQKRRQASRPSGAPDANGRIQKSIEFPYTIEQKSTDNTFRNVAVVVIVVALAGYLVLNVFYEIF